MSGEKWEIKRYQAFELIYSKFNNWKYTFNKNQLRHITPLAYLKLNASDKNKEER